MKNFIELKQFVIEELKDKCNISKEEIGLLDSGTFDIVESCLEFDFALKNDEAWYTFWNNYEDNVGKLIRVIDATKDRIEKEELILSWGDWSIYDSKN
ncbi:hypothetical protein MZM54_01350 [[Brevibacterium] frigoritolerans]|nr:hypothetical protein [Peribacillus frigoritolerans]